MLLRWVERPVERRRIDARSPRTTKVSTSSMCAGSRNEASVGVTVKVASSAPSERETVGARHRIENLAFDALHGEQRHERRHRDRGGEEHRLVDLKHADQDEAQPVGPVRRARRRSSASGRCPTGPRQAPEGRAACPRGEPGSCGSMFSTRITAESTMMPKSTAPTDNRFASSPSSTRMMMLKNSAKGNIDADDDGAAQVAEKDPLNEEDQQAAEDEVVQHRVGGDRDQHGAVVERNDLHARRQRAVAVDLLRPPP